MLTGKRILLGISGGIAAYKCAELTRRLTERGAKVRIVMTAAAKEFITPLTLQAISGYSVSDNLFDPVAEASMGHIELAKWADLILLAPATADLISRLSIGMGNDLLSTIVLATKTPIAVAPSMNQQMYANKATQENINKLRQRHFLIWGPDSGEQACGDIGMGRMLEPMNIVHHCEAFFQPKELQDVSILITAGPTREAIDPVRYISNHSSGKMGYALAEVASQFGSAVTLVSGPVTLSTPHNVNRIDVETAEQMHQVVMEHAQKNQIFIACAAVADFKPCSVSEHKLKKTMDNSNMTINMVKNPDIVTSVTSLTKNRPFTVGFAAETQHIEKYARDKLNKKNLDMICANDVSKKNQGFNSNENEVHLYWKNGNKTLPLDSKINLAQHILKEIIKQRSLIHRDS